MSQAPKSNEWDTSGLPPQRRAYLDKGHTFDEILDFLVSEFEPRKVWTCPYNTRPKGVSKKTRRICFQVWICDQAFDLLYNAPDGLRGKYWQNPELGDQATRSLIGCMSPKLIKFAEDSSSLDMTIKKIQSSLSAGSAKVWIREKDDCGKSMIDCEKGTQLVVARWKKNESQQGPSGRQWRWTPVDDVIEIKGAFLDPDGVEHIPEIKRDRSSQIHLYGFT